MAERHTLHTNLTIEECTNRLKSKAECATIFPEWRGKSVVAGVRRDRFWIQRAHTNLAGRYGDVWAPVFYGRFYSDGAGTRIVGNFGLKPVARVGLITLVPVACLLVFMLINDHNLKNIGFVSLAIIINAALIVQYRYAWREEKRELMSFLRKVFQADEAGN